ncbi:F-box domain-containing protein [Capsaspora owczarzaki ATCC 30864]|uniref:F-box domain-containing protein n=1 Tax=Capsaspora owczarzaki (strain ATCC 30864) TaxID=595528 RepID=A0A0D2WKX6_CAPO3|nr:F-box domain-containing protein [Capsaspora owczarzaki ATCC 30864]
MTSAASNSSVSFAISTNRLETAASAAAAAAAVGGGSLASVFQAPTHLPASATSSSRQHLTKSSSLQSIKSHHSARGDAVTGQIVRKRVQKISEWFEDFNDIQRNTLLRMLIEQSGPSQVHFLSVQMEPRMHKHCPHNCQDILAWLPVDISMRILSYLDVSRAWEHLASDSSLWMEHCRKSEGWVSAEERERQLQHYSHPSPELGGEIVVAWKLIFAERYRLRRNWLNGRYTVRTFEGHSQGISCLQFDHVRIVSGSTDRTIRVWNIRTNTKAAMTLHGHLGTVRCLHLDGTTLFSGSSDRTIKVWDLSTGTCKVTMFGHTDTVRCLRVLGDRVVSGSYDTTLKLWDWRSGSCKLTLRGHSAAVLCVHLDHTKIVSGSMDKTIKVWDAKTGQCLRTLTGHDDAVTCLQFDESKIVSGSLDSSLRFWDITTGLCMGTLDWVRNEGHTGVVRHLQFDSWRMVSAADDKTLKVWNLLAGQRMLTLRHHTDGVTCLQFNDSRIVSGSYDTTVKLYDFSVC